jgi:undecaprenyl diphosphate synthase
MPKHIAMIMDGNGRWATQRGLERCDGHRAGAQNISTMTEACIKAGVKYLTLYAFSTENWKRPAFEVTYLMNLIPEFCKDKLPEMMERGIQLRTIGRTDDLPFFAKNALLDAIEKTKNNDKFVLTIALSYGGRAEIVDAVNKIIAEGKVEKLTEQDFAKYLYAPDIPDPDLMIRAGGEQRLSGFLLWQTSYSELYFADAMWPDFNEEELEKAIDEFNSRKRRFGK